MTSVQPLRNRQYPLSVVLTSAGLDSAAPGSTFTLGVTVHNVGDRSAIVYVFIEERSPILRQWCGSMQESLALATDQSGEVTFEIAVPSAALPELLEYDLIVDGSDSYQDFAPRRYDHYRLQVLPAERTAQSTDEPTFYLEPTSTSRTPQVVQSGVGWPLQVWVDNRAQRVDRFRLNCLGLPPDWRIVIAYPKDPGQLGLIVEADSLGLNPGDQGQILVTITPPVKVLAGYYVPTLRLLSENQPDLNLLDLVYLQILPLYQLHPQLQSLRNQIRTQPALYEIQLDNLGNTPRAIALTVEDLEAPDTCDYRLDAEQVAIAPFSQQRLFLEGMPQNWWQRPLYGAGRFFNFRVRLDDPEQYPLLVDTLPGNVLWLPRPWWQLLLVVLTVLGAVGILLGLLWWLLFKPPVLPQIVAFETQDSRYAEANGDFARVSWTIANAHRVQSLTLVGYSPEGELLSAPLTYTFDRGNLPQALTSFCLQQRRELSCTNVRTNASRPGTYQFELTVTPRRRPPKTPITATSGQVVIEPRPLVLPEIQELVASRLLYQEVGSFAAAIQNSETTDEALLDSLIDANGIRLNWMVANPAALAALKLEARGEDDRLIGEVVYDLAVSPEGVLELPEPLNAACQLGEQRLLCQDVPTLITEVGVYTFTLTAIPQDSGIDGAAVAALTAQTESVAIQPLPPAIAAFQINGQPARPKYLIPVVPGAPPPVVTLTWQVFGGATTSAQLLPVPGAIPLAGSAQLPLNPQGNTLITLQATNNLGKEVAQSVQIETFNPNPADPAAAAAAAAAAALSQTDDGSGDEVNGSEGIPNEPERIAPLDVPPRFD